MGSIIGNLLRKLEKDMNVNQNQTWASHAVERFRQAPIMSREDQETYLYHLILNCFELKDEDYKYKAMRALENLGGRIYTDENVKWHYNQGLEDMALQLVPNLLIEDDLLNK